MKTFRALIELNFNTEIILYDHFQILAVGDNAQAVCFSAFYIRHPGATEFLGQTNTRGVELIRSTIELIAIFLQAFRIVRRGLACFSHFRKFARAKPKKPEQTLIAIIIEFIVDQTLFQPLRQMFEMDERSHAEVIAEAHEDGPALMQNLQRSIAA